MGKFRPVAGLSGRAKNMSNISTFDAPSSPAAHPSLGGYRTAETADGPRRRQSVLQMRAQMLRSLFLAPCTAPSSRCSRPLFSGSLHTPPVFEICALPSQELTGNLGPNQVNFRNNLGGLPIESLIGAKSHDNKQEIDN